MIPTFTNGGGLLLILVMLGILATALAYRYVTRPECCHCGRPVDHLPEPRELDAHGVRTPCCVRCAA